MAPPRLIYRGGRRLAALAYKTFYYGAAWRQNPAYAVINPHAAARALIDAAVAAAMQDGGLNAHLAQYFPGQAISATPLPSEILDDDPRAEPVSVPFDEVDIRRIIPALVASRMGGLDLATTAINIVLPHGMALQALGLDESARPAGIVPMPGVPRDRPTSPGALAGYHGTVPVVVGGTTVEVLYSVVVWSDGMSGIPVPGWQGWECIAATLYHELQEIRTNPDVDCAVRSGDCGFIGWNSDPQMGPDGADCREIADLPLLLNPARQFDAFARVAVVDAAGAACQVPIQRMWSNAAGGMVP